MFFRFLYVWVINNCIASYNLDVCSVALLVSFFSHVFGITLLGNIVFSSRVLMYGKFVYVIVHMEMRLYRDRIRASLLFCYLRSKLVLKLLKSNWCLVKRENSTV